MYSDFKIIESGLPKYWILQIADVKKNLDVFDFYNGKEILFQADNVVGSGIKECTDIVECFNPNHIPALKKINAKKKNYILIVSSRLVTRGGKHLQNQLSLDHYTNAHVILEERDQDYALSPIDHFGGKQAMTGKLFGVINPNITPNDYAEHQKRRCSNSSLDIFLYPGHFRVVASEKQQKMQVIGLD